MKIALIRKDYIASRGGAEQYAVNLARGLADRGHEIHVFAGSHDHEPHPDISVHTVPFFRFPSALKNLSFHNNARRLIARQPFDIINGLSQTFPQDIYRLGDGIHLHWLKVQTPNPRKRFLKYFSPRHLAILLIEHHIFKTGNFRHIIANSQLCKNQLMHYYGIAPEAITVVHNGVDTVRFTPDTRAQRRDAARRRLGLQGTETVMLFAGHNFKRKGLQFAVQTLAGLKQRGCSCKLLVSGRGNPQPFLKLARSMDVASRLHFLGPTNTIEELYAAADLLIHPALYDPFSNVCLEALACGLPVVTSSMNGAAEIIADGRSGLVVELPWDSNHMTAAIHEALSGTRSGLAVMGTAAAAAARQFTIGRNIAETLMVYEKVFEKKRRNL